mmetsp:Transcript_26159/g.63788  ORF Transcript_26159/g.63788 Transcript_26159/m.63788 type:complete len:271 (+) Transcript_26159:273-1085(+)
MVVVKAKAKSKMSSRRMSVNDQSMMMSSHPQREKAIHRWPQLLHPLPRHLKYPLLHLQHLSMMMNLHPPRAKAHPLLHLQHLSMMMNFHPPREMGTMTNLALPREARREARSAVLPRPARNPLEKEEKDRLPRVARNLERAAAVVAMKTKMRIRVVTKTPPVARARVARAVRSLESLERAEKEAVAVVTTKPWKMVMKTPPTRTWTKIWMAACPLERERLPSLVRSLECLERAEREAAAVVMKPWTMVMKTPPTLTRTRIPMVACPLVRA